MIDLCLLGSGGMMPLPDRWLNSLLIRSSGKMILIDCGEGTQIPVRMSGWGFVSIEAVLFTHYHADHIAGLPGLLLAMGNSGRKEPVSIFGPPGLKRIAQGLTVIAPVLPFDLKLIELSSDCADPIRLGGMEIEYLPVEHTLQCFAYSIKLKRPGKFEPEKAIRNGVPQRIWNRLQKGETVLYDGSRYEPDMVLGKPRKGLKICFCTDSRPSKQLAFFAADSDLLVCEGMYGSDDFEVQALEKKHMLFSEAAHIAQKSKASELWLTHYSPQLKDPEEYLQSVREIFPNTYAGHDLMKKTLRFDPEA